MIFTLLPLLLRDEVKLSYDAVGELLGLLNGYSYTGGNPVNLVDHNGMCWTNASASSEQQTQCFDAWKGYTDVVTDTYTQNWSRDVQILMTQEARYWSELSYTEFVNQWNSFHSPSRTNLGEGLQQGAALAVGTGVITGPTPDDILWAAGALCLYGAALIAQTSAVSLPLRPAYDFGGNVYEYRLSGLDRKVGSLAEHLAKLLEHDVAGYSPSGPNPNRDPDRGWCNTIKRIIEEIDGADYSQN